MLTSTIKTYSELAQLKTFKERYNYLRLAGAVGESTFGFDRYLNQVFYRSQQWKRIRDQVIIRDKGCDLGILGHEIFDKIIIHHMNPITIRDIEYETEFLLNPDYLICTTHNTHNAIHYGNESLLIDEPVIRTPYDTCPWKLK